MVNVQFNILGPLEVVDRGRVVPLGGVKQRAMLGMLLLKANRVVPSSTLLDYLWVDGAPPTARKMLQNAASALRDVLASDGSSADPPVLLTHTPGYLLHVEPGTIDLSLFTLHTERGRLYAAEADWESARRELRSALGVWRGPVLADVTEACALWPEAGTVQNTYLVVTEELFDAELACGRHREVVAELESVAGRELSRERLVAQLMLALYRCGRQMDALNLYRRARDSLIENHGLEPSRELQELEHSILNQDKRLDWRGGAMPAVGDSSIARAPRPTAALGDTAVPAALPEARSAGPRRKGPASADGRVMPRAQGQLVSMMAVVTEMDRTPEAASALGMIAEIVCREISRYGGVLVSRVASVSWAVFDDADHAVDQAVKAGLAIRDALTKAQSIRDAADSEAVKVVIVSTDEILSYQPGDGTLRGLDSAVVGRCLQLASAVPAGRVWVGEETKRAAERCVRYERAGDGVWEAVERLPQSCPPDRVKIVMAGPGAIQNLRGLLASIGGQHASRLIEGIGSRSTDIPENALVEVTVTVLPADDIPGCPPAGQHYVLN
jgi:DNA-binding SARP family transcriptional activator